MIVRHSLYGPELNAQIVHEYFSTAQSINDLSEKYYIGVVKYLGYLVPSSNGSINEILLLISN